eukprot:TRINITY_DN8681_c0_g2_i1.p1 TRINITY_DN8681_c0_g2~~TRINITY_DN8681_c0_g2_i1.p1  ORF type:complete len:476 (+),score=91.99 TRINITY_DN8681_c0_g2_i1:61-1488(+)
MAILPETANDGAEVRSPSTLQRNFWWMIVWFSLNHGTVTTPLIVASSLLDERVAYIGNGVLYLGTCISGLFLGAPVSSTYGPKVGLMAGMFLYCLYVLGFTLAAAFEGQPALSASCWVIGSACGGMAAGVLWTAQGTYISTTATMLAEVTEETRDVLTARLFGHFAWVYLVLEVGSKVCFSGLQVIGMPTAWIGLIYTALSFISLGLMVMAADIRNPTTVKVQPPCAKVFAAASLWGDVVLWMLSPSNLAFGFCAAFMNGYVNSHFTKVELSANYVASLGALTALFAAVMSPIFGRLGGISGKGSVLAIGGLCFMMIPISLVATVGCLGKSDCESGWGWWLVVLYLLQGSGRAVYESTNKAVFADFFVGSRTEGAFANCMLQSSLSFAISFFLQASVMQGLTLEIIIIVLAGLMVVMFPLAKYVQHRRTQMEAEAPAKLEDDNVAATDKAQEIAAPNAEATNMQPDEATAEAANV